MTSVNSALPNVSDLAKADKTPDRPLLGGNGTEKQRLLIDTACARINKKRAQFVVEAAVERAVEIIGEDAARQLIADAAA